MSKVDVNCFLDLLRKSTCNYSIDTTQLKFDAKMYNVGMRGTNCIVLLNGINDIIDEIENNDTWELNFSNVSKNVKSYFDLIIPDENGKANIKMKDEKIIVSSGKQKSNLFFCADIIVDTFDGDGPKVLGDTVYETQLNQDFIDVYSLIKKIGGSFGKIYFVVKDGKLSMEVTDKTNPLSNGMSFEIGDTKYDDLEVCFEFKTFNNIMSLINGDFEDFSFRIGYVVKNKGGMISLIKNDEVETEKYYMLSMRESTV